MAGDVLQTGKVALLDANGRLLDDQIPPALLQAAAATIAARDAAVIAQHAAEAAAVLAGSSPEAAASAAAAAAAQLAAQNAQTAAEQARDAAIAAAGTGGSATSAYVDAQIQGLAAVARSGVYADLSNKPTIPTTAAGVGAVDLLAVGAANGVAPLDPLKHLQYAFAPAGSRFDIFCTTTTGGVTFDQQPLRASLSSRTDIYFRFFKRNTILTTTGYAIPGDSWVRWSG